MNKNKFIHFMSMILIAAMIMMTATACSKDNDSIVGDTSKEVQLTELAEQKSSEESTKAQSETLTEASAEASSTVSSESSDDSEKTRFTFIVVDREGNETSFDISTDRKIVGEALQDEKLIEGEAGAYGLYVKKVNGIEAVYEKDGTYWAFYINGEYAMTGVDTTEIEEGAAYMFKVEE